ncbi:MAG: hypothetical protein ACHQ7H_05165 [Candidatus Rokuibacteriota bacterium]
MRQALLRGALLSLLLTPITAGCVLPPESGSSRPPETQVVQADARALAYGRSAAEILDNAQIRDRVRALFGADWAPPTPGGVGKLSAAAPEYFEVGGPVRMVRMGDAGYITVTGCAKQTCASRRGLLVIREGGEQLMARLSEGGFLHHYAYGPGVVGGAAGAGPVLESVVRELERVSEGSPYPRPAP